MGHPGTYIILLSQFIGQPLGDLVQKFLTVHTAGLEAGLHQPQQVFCHISPFRGSCDRNSPRGRDGLKFLSTKIVFHPTGQTMLYINRIS